MPRHLNILREMFLAEETRELTPQDAEREAPGCISKLPAHSGVARLYVIDGMLLADIPGKMDSLQWSAASQQWEPV